MAEQVLHRERRASVQLFLERAEQLADAADALEQGIGESRQQVRVRLEQPLQQSRQQVSMMLYQPRRG